MRTMWTQVKVPPFDCTTALQIGCGSKKAKRMPSKEQGPFRKHNLPFKAKLVRVLAGNTRCCCIENAFT